MSSQLEKLEALLHKNPGITYATPSSANYAELRAAYILDSEQTPLAIVRPRTAEEVAVIVAHAAAEGLTVSVRNGGNDLFGRCFATGAVAIDVRELASVTVAADGRSATAGGGVSASTLAGELARHGLVTTFGSVPAVGWVGWATHGGYGPFAAHYGLGVDQILAATVVNAEGAVVPADADMLAAIRGGGGSVGVVVDITMRVYPLKQILGGVIVYQAGEQTGAGLAATFRRFTAGYRALAEAPAGLPAALGIQQSFVNTPMGKVFAALFVWSSDDVALGQQWLDKICALGDVAHCSVEQRGVAAWLDDAGAYVPKSAYGGNETVSVTGTSFSDAVVDAVGEQIARMPTDPSTLFSIHQLRGPSSTARADVDAVFGARRPHYVLEFISTSSTPEGARVARQWAVGFRDAIRAVAGPDLAPFTYISLTPPADANFASIYGSSWDRLVAIKHKYDPKNVFRHAMPQFG